MKEKKITTVIKVYESPGELPGADRELLKLSKATLPDSYSPYSGFQVAAAVRLANGEMLGGANQENASYAMCLCAERVALASAQSRYPSVPVEAIAITVRKAEKEIDQPAAPCGACRQVLLETEERFQTPVRIILQGNTGRIYVLESAKDLLPLPFNKSFL